jgi:DNA-binding NarL/FixJ family response regulator
VSATIRIALLDDFPAVRASLVDMLDDADDIIVVEQAGTGAELLDIMASTPVDLVLAEPWLKSDDGLNALTHISEAFPDVTIVALSGAWDNAHVQPLRSIGARAYIPKSIDLPEVLQILRQAHKGLQVFPVGDAPGKPALLTRREVEVLRLAAEGVRNQEIADQLFVSERTVKFHLQNAYRKLGAHNRTAAAAAARRRGLL